MSREGLSKEKLISMYKTMLLTRRFEETLRDLYRLGLVKTAHLCDGQEAIPAGVHLCLREDDYIVSAHRGHGHMLARGAPVNKIIAESLNKATGLFGGMSGSERIAWIEGGMLWMPALVGSQLPIAAGVGYAIKLRKTDQVVMCTFGDAASNVGDFHEALNYSSLWKLPVVYVCENNLYGQYTHVKRSTSIENIADRACAYNIPGVIVDGMDPVAVYNAMKEAVDRARRGEGPTLIECKTYRYCGHFEGDPQVYKDSDEAEEWKKKDPIELFKAKLLRKGVKARVLDDIRKEIDIKLKEAVKFGKESPETPVEELYKHVY